MSTADVLEDHCGVRFLNPARPSNGSMSLPSGLLLLPEADGVVSAAPVGGERTCVSDARKEMCPTENALQTPTRADGRALEDQVAALSRKWPSGET